MPTWGSTRVTQKWDPHIVVSSCVCVDADADADEVEGRECLGRPFICTSGVEALLILPGEALSCRELEETFDARGLAGACPFVYTEK